MRFSIVIVNFNTGSYLEEAILSVINQSFKDYELILVDGGSSDKSIEIIERYKMYFSWYVSEPDKGQSDAFNKGFSHAKGEYYCWLNADDLMMPNALYNVNKYIDKYPEYSWFAPNTVYVNSLCRIIKIFYGTEYSNFVLRNGTVEVAGPSTFFHRDLFLKYGPFDLSYHYTMDGDLWEKFVLAGYRFKRIKFFCWVFRVHDESKTSGVFLGKRNEKVIEESMRRKKKNGKIVKRSVFYFQYLKKILYSYPTMLYLNLLNKNKIISNTLLWKNGK